MARKMFILYLFIIVCILMHETTAKKEQKECKSKSKPWKKWNWLVYTCNNKITDDPKCEPKICIGGKLGDGDFCTKRECEKECGHDDNKSDSKSSSSSESKSECSSDKNSGSKEEGSISSTTSTY